MTQTDFKGFVNTEDPLRRECDALSRDAATALGFKPTQIRYYLLRMPTLRQLEREK